MQVKICGLARKQDAGIAEEAGADFLGVILAGGPRKVSEAQAAVILGPRRHGVRRVAVFGAASVMEIAAVARRLSLDVVQLHGDPTVQDIASLQSMVDCAVWPVLRVDGMALPATATALAKQAGMLVLDAMVPGQLGGTGVSLNWRALARDIGALRAELPALCIVLAGGLTVRNVGEAIGLLQPDVVDVSSGVEAAPGIKDADAIVAFVKAARNAG